jgi:hypothetical protein
MDKKVRQVFKAMEPVRGLTDYQKEKLRILRINYQQLAQVLGTIPDSYYRDKALKDLETSFDAIVKGVRFYV